MSPEQLKVLEDKLIEKAFAGDPVKMEQFRRELEASARALSFEGTAEVVL